MGNAGNLINAAAIIIAAFLLVWFGLKPALRVLLESPPVVAQAPAPLALEGRTAGTPSLAGPETVEQEDTGYAARRKANTPQQKLEKMVEANEEAVAALMKQLLRS